MHLRELTLADIQRIQKERLYLLLQEAGTVRHLAFMLDTPVGTVNGWIERGRISKVGARKVEQHPTLGIKFSAYDLRPDMQI